MAKYKIVIAEGNRPSMYINRIEKIKKDFLSEDFDCFCIDAPDEEAMLKHVNEPDALIVSPGMAVTAKAINKFTKCKSIVSLAVGYDNIDIELAGKKGILVCNVPDYGTEEVADVALAFILNLSRKITFYNLQFKQNNENWNWRLGIPINRLRDRVLGIIGLGRIGTALAIRAKAIGFKICFYDPYKEDGYDKAISATRIHDLEELCGLSDVISIHAPLTSQTKAMVNRNFLNSAKKGAILINTARGQIFESIDIIEWALRNNIIDSIATDVLPQEPPDENHPLFKAWRANEEWIKGRLIISPHAAFYSEEAGYDLCSKAVITARDSIFNKGLRNIVNKEFIARR